MNSGNYIIFHSHGSFDGIHTNSSPDKDLVATSVVNSLKETYPEKKIIVISHFPEVWLHNPDVHRFYRFGATPYFYEDYIKEKNSTILAYDPYQTTDFINKKKHLAEIWCDLIGVKYNGSLPKLHFTQREEEVAWRLTRSDKPLFFFQPYETHGSVPGLINSWTKDIPPEIGQKIVDKMKSNGYEVIQISNENQPALVGTRNVKLNLRLLMASLKHAAKGLYIDSFAAQVATAHKNPSVVTWLTSIPKLKDYGLHQNYFAKTDTKLKEKLDEYSPTFDMVGKIASQKVDISKAYDVEEILKLLEVEMRRSGDEENNNSAPNLRSSESPQLDNPNQIIFNISGGIGKNIMATAVVNSLKEQYPKTKIIVASAWKDVWQNNPDIETVVNAAEDETFYKKYVVGKNNLCLLDNPYIAEDFLYKKKHLIETWCEMYRIKYNGSQPKLYFTEEEKKVVSDKLPKDKPLFFIQVSGGASVQEYPISWMRDLPLPLAQKVVDHMNEKGYRTIHVRREDQYPLENTDWIKMNIREVMCATQFANKSLYIDSVAQHAAAALEKPAVVTWVGNKPEIFGYEMHKNILPSVKPEFRHYMDSYFDQWDIAGKLHECPYDTNEIFDFNEIIKKLEE